MEAELLIPRLLKQAKAQPNKVLFEYVNDDGVSLAKQTYQEFENQTNRLARQLVRHKQKNPSAGNFALLVYPPGIHFIIAFIACLRAGVIAVPVYPPRGARNKDLTMFLAVHDSCKAKLALTNSHYNFASRVASIKDSLGSMFASRKDDGDLIGRWPDDLEWIVTDTYSGDLATDADIDKMKPEDVAFLQYTSGSTSLPKGVVLSHANLAHNLATIIAALKADESVVVVSWLPMYHDMGLIGSHLGTIYCGGSATLMSPIAFVKNPPMWIDLVSSRRGTHLQAPNFAYRLTVRKFLARQSKMTQTTKPDLSSVRHIFNAAEPIDPSAIDEFCDTFGKFGLKREAMIPGYGLAEHTVYVCDGGKQRLTVKRSVLEKQNRLEFVTDATSLDKMTLVGCGSAPVTADIRILIVDPNSRCKLADGFVGEIWVTSASKATAYYGLPEKSASDLHARLLPSKFAATSDSPPNEEEKRNSSSSLDIKVRTSSQEPLSGTGPESSDPRFNTTSSDEELTLEWLRTGDLGVWYQGELFVCGRIKDLLIVRGRNHFPQDIEATVERTDRERIRPGCCAAFTTEVGGDESVVVCLEVRSSVLPGETANDIISRVRTNIAKEHGIAPQAVVLLIEHSIPKTTSGKISRHRVKQAYLTKTLKQVASWERAEDGDDEAAAMALNDGELATKATAVNASRTTLKGAELMEKLKAEAGSLLEREPATLDENVQLNELGFDSMMLTQFKGAVINVLGVELPDEQLFDEKCTLSKVREMVESGGAVAAVSAKQNIDGAPHSASSASRGDPLPASVPKTSDQKQPLLGSWKPGQKCGFCGC